MTIEDPERYLKNVWNWNILSGCFGKTKIMPTDIDGAVERNQQFLFMDAKEPSVVLDPNDGQTKFYLRLAQKPGITVFFVWGHKDQPEAYQVYTRTGNSRKLTCNLESFRAAVSRWFELAEEHRSPLIHPEDLE